MAISIELDSDVTVHVTSEHPHHHGRWIFHCPALAMQDEDLGAVSDIDADEATALALACARGRAIAVFESLSGRIWQEITRATEVAG